MKLINYLSRAEWNKHKGAIHPMLRILSSRTPSAGGIFWICTEDDKAGTMRPLSTSTVASATKGLDVSFYFVFILIESSQVAGGYYVAHFDSKLRVNTTKGLEGMGVEG